MLDEAFKKLKTNLELNESFDARIQQRHGAVRSAIENIEPSLKTQLIGSLQRRTRIQPRQADPLDMDILVIMGTFYNWVAPGEGGVTAAAAMAKANDILAESDRYSAMDPQIDDPTITFKYSDETKVELVPAYIDGIGRSPDGTPHTPTGRGFWVAKNGGWELADYDFDAEHLTEQNAAADTHLVPTIKMLKALKREYFPKMGSFHLEILAARVLPPRIAQMKAHGETVTYPALITAFFEDALPMLGEAVRMPGSNGPRICMSPLDISEVGNAFGVILRFCRTIEAEATETAQVEKWRELFGVLIPYNVYA